MSEKLRGHEIYKDREGNYRFKDTGQLTTETWFKRPCGHCYKFGNSNDGEPDPCLGNLPGVTNACCGHGEAKDSYMCFEGGLVIRGFTVERPTKN